MARRARLRLARVPMHVIQRGNNHGAIFFAPSDYDFYLDRLDDAMSRHGCAIHAYVLMTNHVHLLLTPFAADAVSLAMRDLGRCYVQQYINKAYARSGTLWEGRFKASLVAAEDYFLTCCRYIELNPVRAGMVSHPADYRWSSYRHHALGEPNSCLTSHPLFRRLGASPEERRSAYQALFRHDLEAEELRTIRVAANGGWPVGGECFKDQIEAALERPARPPRRGRPQQHGRKCGPDPN
ncbi:MAG TPA: transposase [Burkholderiales bacterium]|nr:transposase [Burkholderiales bacterium]